MKAYKFMDIETKEIFVSRDVTFQEDIFPFTYSSKNLSHNPFDSIVIPNSYNIDDSFQTDQDSSSSSPVSSLHPHPQSFSPNSSSQSSEPSQQPTKPIRARRPPSYLQDYHCNLINNIIVENRPKYPLSDVVSYSNLSSQYKAYTLAISSEIEPKNYKEASQSSAWVKAMHEELQALKANYT